MVGYGSGTLTLVGDESISTDLEMTMGALGVRGELLSPSRSGGGLALAVRSDALWTRTSSSLVNGQLLAADAAASRLRLVLEVSRPVPGRSLWVVCRRNWATASRRLRARGCRRHTRASLAEGAGQAWHVGARLTLRESLNLSLEASRRQRQDEAAAQELALLATVPW